MADQPIQSARQVAYRALCLGTLIKRHSLEVAINNIDDLPHVIQDGWQQEHEGIHLHLKKWVVKEKILNHFSSDERLLWDAELGDWQQLDRAKIYWRCESLGMLMWAMRFVDVPYYDTQFDLEAVLNPLDLLNPTIDFVWMAQLRNDTVIGQARDLAKIWHWRALAKVNNIDLEQIKQMADKMYTAGNLPDVIDGDFPARGKAYSQLDDDDYTKVASIAKERHYALSWLYQPTDSWDDVITDVS